jgi:hypothetical protein
MTDRYPTPRDRRHFPFMGEPAPALMQRFDEAISSKDLETASFAFLELRHRRPKSAWVRDALARFDSIGTQPVEWIGIAHAVAQEFKASARGWGSVYLVLLDTRDHKERDWGVYVGQSRKDPEMRYREHCTGVRASGRVRRRHAGLLRLPVRHLRRIKLAEAKRIEAELAAALAERGLVVRGGH